MARKVTIFAFMALVAVLAIPTMSNATTGNGGSGQAESRDEASATVLADVKIKGKIDRRSCKWVKGGYNSGKDANGKLQYFYDGKRAKVCRNKKSPTGWVKVAGGLTGRNCGNPWRFTKPKVVVKNVVMIRNWIKVTASATAHVRVEGSCGFAEASATASATVKARIRIEGRGAAETLAYASARAQATAKASASLNCTTPPPPPPTCQEVGNCPPPPCTQNCTPSMLILSMTDLNDIPTGKSSGPYYVEVSASDTGGTLTVDPGIGSITDCNGGPREGSMTLPVPKGVTKFCFVIWAPDDPAKPSEMTVTATAVLGNSSAHKEDVLGITYPIRPE